MDMAKKDFLKQVISRCKRALKRFRAKRTKLIADAIKGKWQIINIENGAPGAVDGSYIEFVDSRNGTTRFGDILADIDYCISDCGKVEFSFYGDYKDQPACGRGWVKISSIGELCGCMLVHKGNSSEFRAEKVSESKLPPLWT